MFNAPFKTGTHGNPGSAGIVPGINFGAIWDKYVNGNQAADIIPGANFSAGNRNNVAPQGPSVQGPMIDNSPAGGGASGGSRGYSGGYATAPSINRNSIMSQAQRSRDTALGAARNSFGDLDRGYRSGMDSLLQKLRVGQQGIDQARENNALNRIRSLSDLRDSVRQGVQSGSVQLSNNNALDSSAAEALAKGYGRFGTQQQGDIMNEYALANRDIDTQQSNLNFERDQGLRDLENYKMSQANQIGNSVYDRLAAISEAALGQGVDGAVGDVNSYKQQIINEALGAIQALDQQLRSGLGGIQALGQDQVEANAYKLANAGGKALPENTFTYETAPGVGAIQNGAPIAQFPMVRRRENQ